MALQGTARTEQTELNRAQLHLWEATSLYMYCHASCCFNLSLKLLGVCLNFVLVRKSVAVRDGAPEGE